MSKEDIQDSTRSSAFSMPKYMLKLVLPKCSMAHGGIITSVYFQIAFNINNQEKAKSWQYLKCWKDPNKIAAEIGCNSRKAKSAIKILVELGLLEGTLHGKLKMYRLLNDKIVNEQKLLEFINDFDKKLINSVSKSKMQELRDQVSELNNNFDSSSSFNLKDMLKRFWIPDLLFIKQLFVEAETTYKGSSLFFMNILEDKFQNYKKNTNLFNTISNDISESQKALRLGCSQATLSRYTTTYEGSIVLNKVDAKIRELLEKNLIELKNTKSKKSNCVVESMSGIHYYCPICDRDFNGSRSLGMHLGKMQDEGHIWFNQLRKDKRCPYENFAKLYEEHKSQIEHLLVKEEVEIEIKDEYMKVPCPCKISCKECRLHWHDEFFKDCKLERKIAFVKEYGLDREVNNEPKPKKSKEVKEIEFGELPSTKKPVNHGEDTAPGLLKFFYDMTGGRSPNWGKECGQIKSHMKKDLTPDEVRVILKHMARKGQMDLRFFTTSINDALLESKFMNELDQAGTPAYLVKYFYESHGLKVNIQTLVKDVQKIIETINSGLTYEETKVVLDYMIAQKCTILNFIASKRTEALAKYKQSGIESTPTSGFKNNPSFFDQDEINIIKDELAGGRIRISKIKDSLKAQAIEVCKQLFKEKKFTTRYTSFEWAWRVGLELDPELYQLGVKDLNKETYIDFALRNSNHISPDKFHTLERLKASFEVWVAKQHETFGNNNLFTIK